ncbi:MAG: YfhO family protein [Gemmatimonadetes bacterium]|nr:YfhO family protein [Gemmatimonadota bacterium]
MSAKKRKGGGGSAGAPAVEGSGRIVFWSFLGSATAVALLFFGAFVVDRGAMLFGTDMVSQAYQSRAFAVQEVEAGRGLPQWNPFVYAGLPYLSILPYPVWYPTSLLYFAIPLHRAIGWAFVLHLVLAGMLAYLLARELRLKPGAAVVAGVAYMFTGYIVSHLYAGQDGRMFAMQWTPALFLFAERAISRRRLHWFGWLALVVVLQLFTPHVQMAYFAAMAVGAYVLFRLVRIWRVEREWKPVVALLAGFVGAYLLAALVALIEIWPTANMLEFSHRADRGYAYASSWSMPVRETLAMIWPRFQGYLEGYWGTNPFKLHTEYVGAVPLLLTGLALLARRNARTWFFAALAAGALLFAWGGATPVHRIFYWILPVMKSFRAPAMMYSVVALAVVVLAGFGAQALYDRRDALADRGHPAWKVLGGLAVVWIVAWFWAAGAPDSFAGAVAGFLYGPLEPAREAAMRQAMPRFAVQLGLFALFWAGGLAVCWAAARRKLAPLLACSVLAAFTVIDLWVVDKDFYDTFEIERLAVPDDAVRFLQGQEEPFRVLPLPGAYGPNDLMLFRIPVVSGSQNFRLRWWDDLVGEDLARIADTRIWSLLNVRYVVSGQPIEFPALEEVHRGTRIVYRSTLPASGAWIVHEAVALPEGTTVERVLETDFDPRRIALLPPDATPPSLAPAAGPERVEWVERRPDRLVLEVQASSDGLLVLSEIHHPYWSATLDGEPVEIQRVDFALRGVAVPAGSHRIEMRFRDPYVTYGMWGSLAGAALLVGFLAGTWRRRGRAEAGPGDEP